METKTELIIDIDSKTIELLSEIDFHPRLRDQLQFILKEYKVGTKEELDAILEDFIRPSA